MEVIRLSLSSYKILLISFGISINEMKVYQHVVPQLPSKEIKDILQQPVSTWKEDLKNDLEEIVFSQYPEIKNIREELYNRGAVYASLNGSSSTVFGIFHPDTIDFRLNENYFQHWVTLP
jgi:4-diphosphocytidyl-2-C-methyl-D-erythritol kinase